MKKKVCMFVLNPCTNDARVIKEAETLGRSGCDVTIIGIISEDVSEVKVKKEFFTIYRIRTRTMLYYIYRLLDRRKLLYSYLKKILQHGPYEQRAGNKATDPASGPFAAKHLVKILRVVKNAAKNYLHKFHRVGTYLSYWVKAKNLAVSFRADVYHAHDLNTLLPAYLAARKTGAKVVYDSHEFYTERNTLIYAGPLSKWIVKQFEKFFIRRVASVITVNESIAVELSKLYNIPVPFVIMNCPSYHLADRNNRLREIIGINGSHRVILYLGKITFNRGLEESITAIRGIPEGVLVVMGYGAPDYIAGLKSHAERQEVQDRVYFVPPVPPNEVVRYAASADIGLVPIQNACKSYYYCSPNKLFESMMAGLPVAASDFPELKRVVDETNCGVLFDPSRPEEIARALNSMIGDAAMCERMRSNALKHAHKYSWEEQSQKLLSIYAKLFSE